jgi:hypothetical protein
LYRDRTFHLKRLMSAKYRLIKLFWSRILMEVRGWDIHLTTLNKVGTQLHHDINSIAFRVLTYSEELIHVCLQLNCLLIHCISSSFQTVFNSTECCTTSNLETRVYCNWKGRGRKRFWTILRHHPRICLEELTYTSAGIYYLWPETQGPNIQHIAQQWWQFNFHKLVFCNFFVVISRHSFSVHTWFLTSPKPSPPHPPHLRDLALTLPTLNLINHPKNACISDW